MKVTAQLAQELADYLRPRMLKLCNDEFYTDLLRDAIDQATYEDCTCAQLDRLTDLVRARL